MPRLELEVANEAARELDNHGFAELKYITAEFEPYSSAQRPDLVFWPGTGPNEGRAFVVELRMPIIASQTLLSPEVLLEHRNFFETDPPDSLCFALATGRSVDESYRSALSNLDIQVLENIASGSDLADRILKWSGTK